MSNENRDGDTFDVVELGGTDERQYMIVFYRGCMHQIPSELLGNTGIWFWSDEVISAVFGDEHSFYMPFVIGLLSSVLKEYNAELPIRGVDVKKLSEIAHTTRGAEAVLKNFTSYYKSLIEPRPAVDAGVMPRASAGLIADGIPIQSPQQQT